MRISRKKFVRSFVFMAAALRNPLFILAHNLATKHKPL